MCERVCVRECVFTRERERARECVRERVSVRECVCARECVYQRERENERVRACGCLKSETMREGLISAH